jgi:hypothetical protein
VEGSDGDVLSDFRGESKGRGAIVIGVWSELCIEDSDPNELERWRICWNDDDGIEWASRYGFMRKRDADAAIAALDHERVTRADLIAVESLREFDAIVFGALGW